MQFPFDEICTASRTPLPSGLASTENRVGGGAFTDVTMVVQTVTRCSSSCHQAALDSLPLSSIVSRVESRVNGASSECDCGDTLFGLHRLVLARSLPTYFGPLFLCTNVKEVDPARMKPQLLGQGVSLVRENRFCPEVTAVGVPVVLRYLYSGLLCRDALDSWCNPEQPTAPSTPLSVQEACMVFFVALGWCFATPSAVGDVPPNAVTSEDVPPFSIVALVSYLFNFLVECTAETSGVADSIGNGTPSLTPLAAPGDYSQRLRNDDCSAAHYERVIAILSTIDSLIESQQHFNEGLAATDDPILDQGLQNSTCSEWRVNTRKVFGMFDVSSCSEKVIARQQGNYGPEGDVAVTDFLSTYNCTDEVERIQDYLSNMTPVERCESEGSVTAALLLRCIFRRAQKAAMHVVFRSNVLVSSFLPEVVDAASGDYDEVSHLALYAFDILSEARVDHRERRRLRQIVCGEMIAAIPQGEPGLRREPDSHSRCSFLSSLFHPSHVTFLLDHIPLRLCVWLLCSMHRAVKEELRLADSLLRSACLEMVDLSLERGVIEKAFQFASTDLGCPSTPCSQWSDLSQHDQGQLFSVGSTVFRCSVLAAIGAGLSRFARSILLTLNSTTCQLSTNGTEVPRNLLELVDLNAMPLSQHLSLASPISGSVSSLSVWGALSAVICASPLSLLIRGSSPSEPPSSVIVDQVPGSNACLFQSSPSTSMCQFRDQLTIMWRLVVTQKDLPLVQRSLQLLSRVDPRATDTFSSQRKKRDRDDADVLQAEDLWQALTEASRILISMESQQPNRCSNVVVPSPVKDTAPQKCNNGDVSNKRSTKKRRVDTVNKGNKTPSKSMPSESIPLFTCSEATVVPREDCTLLPLEGTNSNAANLTSSSSSSGSLHMTGPAASSASSSASIDANAFHELLSKDAKIFEELLQVARELSSASPPSKGRQAQSLDAQADTQPPREVGETPRKPLVISSSASEVTTNDSSTYPDDIKPQRQGGASPAIVSVVGRPSASKAIHGLVDIVGELERNRQLQILHFGTMKEALGTCVTDEIQSTRQRLREISLGALQPTLDVIKSVEMQHAASLAALSSLSTSLLEISAEHKAMNTRFVSQVDNVRASIAEQQKVVNQHEMMLAGCWDALEQRVLPQLVLGRDAVVTEFNVKMDEMMTAFRNAVKS